MELLAGLFGLLALLAVPFVLALVALKVVLTLVLLPFKILAGVLKGVFGLVFGLLGGLFGLVAGGRQPARRAPGAVLRAGAAPARAAPPAGGARVAGAQGVQSRSPPRRLSFSFSVKGYVPAPIAATVTQV